MAHLTCHECGKSYNYATEESCPKCGAYNSPKGGSSTQLEGELLSRFGSARANQQRGTQTPPQGRPPQARTPQHPLQPDRRMPPPNQRPHQPNPTTPRTGAWEPGEKTPATKKPATLASIIKTIVIIFILINIAFPALIAMFALT